MNRRLLLHLCTQHINNIHASNAACLKQHARQTLYTSTLVLTASIVLTLTVVPTCHVFFLYDWDFGHVTKRTCAVNTNAVSLLRIVLTFRHSTYTFRADRRARDCCQRLPTFLGPHGDATRALPARLAFAHAAMPRYCARETKAKQTKLFLLFWYGRLCWAFFASAVNGVLRFLRWPPRYGKTNYWRRRGAVANVRGATAPRARAAPSLPHHTFAPHLQQRWHPAAAKGAFSGALRGAFAACAPPSPHRRLEPSAHLYRARAPLVASPSTSPPSRLKTAPPPRANRRTRHICLTCGVNSFWERRADMANSVYAVKRAIFTTFFFL